MLRGFPPSGLVRHCIGLPIRLLIVPDFDPKVLESGLERIFYFGMTNLRKLAGEFRSKFSSEFLLQIFQSCSSRVSGPPTPPKNSGPNLTPKIVGIPFQFHIFEPNFLCSRRFSAYGGRSAHVRQGRWV